MALNALKKLSGMRRVPTNPWAKKAQGMSEEMRKKMMESSEMNRAREMKRQREMYGMEDENKLMAGERKRQELQQRQEIGKTAAFLMKQGYNATQANALAKAFALEMAGLKEELSSQIGEAKTKLVLKEMREKLLSIFKENPSYMGELIKDVKTQQKRFSQQVLAQIRNEVFQRHNIPTE